MEQFLSWEILAFPDDLRQMAGAWGKARA